MSINGGGEIEHKSSVNKSLEIEQMKLKNIKII